MSHSYKPQLFSNSHVLSSFFRSGYKVRKIRSSAGNDDNGPERNSLLFHNPAPSYRAVSHNALTAFPIHQTDRGEASKSPYPKDIATPTRANPDSYPTRPSLYEKYLRHYYLVRQPDRSRPDYSCLLPVRIPDVPYSPD